MASSSLLNRPLRLFLFAPQGLARLMLRGLLQTLEQIEVVGQAGTINSAQCGLQYAQADLLLIDVDHRDCLQLALIAALRRACPTLPLVVLTLFSEHPDSVATLLSLGVRACVDKFVDPQRFLFLLHEVVVHPVGFTLLSSEEINIVDDPDQNPVMESGISATLTSREQHLLMLLLQGQRLHTIAQAMNLGKQTVRNYASVLYEKLGVGSKAELIAQYGRRSQG